MKRRGHYCRICGTWMANEKFSGRGHRAHICKQCAKLPKEKREEMELVNRLITLPVQLSKKQKKWLETMRSHENKAVREAAEYIYEIQTEESILQEEEDLLFSEELLYAMEEELMHSENEDDDPDLGIDDLPF